MFVLVANRLNQMTFKGIFQPKLFYVFVILWLSGVCLPDLHYTRKSGVPGCV